MNLFYISIPKKGNEFIKKNEINLGLNEKILNFFLTRTTLCRSGFIAKNF